jgi:MtN3 and saliva related transmembrane protein
VDNQLLINAVGTLAGVCSMTSFVPQIIKIWREKKAEGVSLRMFSVTVMAFVLWTTYGVLLNSWPIIVSNAVCLVLSATIFGLRLHFGDGAEKAPA